jgi:1,4-alpha-glucan branching enzyme
MEFTAKEKERFFSGAMTDAHKHFGCRYNKGKAGAFFRVYAPRAKYVSVVGDFNDWEPFKNPMTCEDGIWQAAVKEAKEFDGYKYRIETSDGRVLFKSDPYAFHAETGGLTNSKVYDRDDYKWSDGEWFKNKLPPYNRPMNIYEAHIGSWRKYIDGNYFSYRLFADEIVKYLKDMNYTHIELIGVAEYPFDASWGYQVTGYYAPTSRYGLPSDFKYLIDHLHQNGIGVIFDWVPGHFPKDEQGLYEFDGYPLYEPEDELKREHKEWGTRCFDYGRGEVKSFLVSNAMYWLNEFHADGLRVDAVASMLYLDYGRREYRPNRDGGKENYEAIDFLKALNTEVFKTHPNALMIAEESTAWPLVTAPVSDGGLGFNFKWNMGWMNDTLSYVKTDPYFRAGSHDKLTFSMTYAFSENYILPVSHDEIVHGKGSLLNKMPGTYEEKFAGFRNFLMYQLAHPGKKLTMMGTDIAQFSEWDFSKELDWMLLDYPAHKSAQKFVKALNALYVKTPAFWQIDDGWGGFAWRVVDDNSQNVLVFERSDLDGNRLLFVFNFAAAAWDNYRFGAAKGEYEVVLYSDVSGFNAKKKTYKTESVQSHGLSDSLVLDIPSMSGIYMIRKAKADKSPVKPEPEKPAAVKKSPAPAKKPVSKKPVPKTASTKQSPAAAKKPAVKKPGAAKKPVIKNS